MKSILDIQVSQSDIHTISFSHIMNDFEKGYYDSFFTCLQNFTYLNETDVFNFIQSARVKIYQNDFHTYSFKKMKNGKVESVVFTFASN